MKQILITCILFTMLIGTIEAQCLKTTIDDFTGVVTITTKTVTLSNIFKPNYSFTLKSIDNIDYLEFEVTSSEGYSFKEGADLMIKLPDTMITLKNLDYVMPKPFTIGNTTVWTATLYFLINEEFLTKLSTWDISKFRVYSLDGYLEDEVPMQEAVNIRNITKCFIKRNE